jgi:hypothetical protein
MNLKTKILINETESLRKFFLSVLFLALALQFPDVALAQYAGETEAKGAENILLTLPVSPGKDATEEEKAAFAKKQKEEFEKVKENVYESIDKSTGKQIRDKEHEKNMEAIFALLDPYTGKSIREAFAAKDQDQLLKGFKSFSVSVYLNSPATDVISKQDLKTKIELALRRNGIKVDEKFGTSICVSVDAMKLQQERGYFFRTDTKLMDMAYTNRDSGYAKFPLFLWNDGGLGVGPAQTVKIAII